MRRPAGALPAPVRALPAPPARPAPADLPTWVLAVVVYCNYTVPQLAPVSGAANANTADLRPALWDPAGTRPPRKCCGAWTRSARSAAAAMPVKNVRPGHTPPVAATEARTCACSAMQACTGLHVLRSGPAWLMRHLAAWLRCHRAVHACCSACTAAPGRGLRSKPQRKRAS